MTASGPARVPRTPGRWDLVLLTIVAIVIQLSPFVYLFLGLIKTDEVGALARVAGGVGLLATALGTVAAFLPTADVNSVPILEARLILGVVGPTAFGWFLFRRAQPMPPFPVPIGEGT
jgi:hypothetical protein